VSAVSSRVARTIWVMYSRTSGATVTPSAAALLAGRNFVTPDDVKDFAFPVLRHRVVVSPEVEVEGRSSDDVLQAVLMRVTAPQ